jgi:hypothetical protein
MEEMSKKTRRLEKENVALTRKHDLTNRNILEMAEERTRFNKELETLRKKNANLEKLCRGMQAQGRGGPPVEGDDIDGEATDSDYEFDEEDEGSEGDYDESTEEETLPHNGDGPPVFGPVPPPNMSIRVNGNANGIH